MMDEKQQKRVQIDASKLPKKTRHRHRHHHHHHHRGPVYLTTTPDGGWGWIVIFATFMVFVFTLGFKTSMGVFYVHWERHFDVPKYKVSWVTSMSPMVIGIISEYNLHYLVSSIRDRINVNTSLMFLKISSGSPSPVCFTMADFMLHHTALNFK